MKKYLFFMKNPKMLLTEVNHLIKQVILPTEDSTNSDMVENFQVAKSLN